MVGGALLPVTGLGTAAGLLLGLVLLAGAAVRIRRRRALVLMLLDRWPRRRVPRLR